MESNENPDPSILSNRQLMVLPHILSSPSYEEAARRAEISPKQIYEWLKEPAFCTELKKQRNAIFCDSLAFLKTNVQKASQTLVSLLDNKDPRIRLLASDKIISSAFKSTELLDFEERISTLEDIAEKLPKKNSMGAHQ